MNKLTKWQTNKSKHTWNVFNILYITVKHSQLCLFLLWSNVINIQSVYSDLNSIGTNNHKHQTLTVCNHIKHSELRDKKALLFLLNGIYIMKKLCVELNSFKILIVKQLHVIWTLFYVLQSFLGKRSLLNDQNYSYFYTGWPLFYNAHVKHFICK